MEKRELGRTGLFVSRLCFGTLTMGPFQRNLSISEGTSLMERAFSHGVNFLDTAEIYETYPYVKQALKIKPDAIVCTKSYAYTKEMAEESFRKAVEGIGRDHIDIFMLHEQEKVTEIVRVGNGIAQVRFQHGAERRLTFGLTEPFNIADRFGGLSLHNDRQPMLPAELI